MDFRCEYWIHPMEFDSMSHLEISHCREFGEKFDLYDGRTESVCKRCLRYANMFMEFRDRKFVNTMRSIILNYDGNIIQFVHQDLQDLPNEVKQFFDFLDRFNDWSFDANMEILSDIDLDIVHEWIIRYFKHNELNSYD